MTDLNAADAAQLAALTTVSGIDTEHGMRTVRGRLPSYLRLLNSFVATHAQDKSLLESAWRNGEIDEARRIAHNLKGVAGTLGLKGISSAASTLNDALRQERFNEDAATLLEILCAHIEQTCTDLKSVLPPPAPSQ